MMGKLMMRVTAYNKFTYSRAVSEVMVDEWDKVVMDVAVEALRIELKIAPLSP